MIFGGIFRKWFGKRFGKSARMRAAQIRLMQEAQFDEDALRDQNLPGVDFNTDPADGNDGADGGPVDSDPNNDADNPNSNQTIAGRLALDADNDGVVDPIADTDFSSQAPSDWDGLKAFDTNQDGLLDLSDPQWQSLGVWNDANQDGQFQNGEFQTLAALDVAAIDLDAGLTSGELSVTKTDGSSYRLAFPSAA